MKREETSHLETVYDILFDINKIMIEYHNELKSDPEKAAVLVELSNRIDIKFNGDVE